MLTINSCSEPYLNTRLDTNEKIPVFNGTITNINNLNSLSLYYAMPYTDQRQQRIEGASITITDENGNVIQVNDRGSGWYELPNGSSDFQFGKTYSTTIQLANGEILSSNPCKYLDTLPYGSLFFEPNKTLKQTIKTSSGDFVEVSQEGIFIWLKLKQPTLEIEYYRAHANYYVHSQKWINRISEFIINESGWVITYEIRYDTLYDVIEGHVNTNPHLIGELNPSIDYSQNDLTISPLFLKADPDCQNFTNYTSYTFKQWIIPVDLYHCNKEIYNYYSDAYKQLASPGQMFDPIPDQISGNIHNETEPISPALGVFDMASVNRKYMGIYVHESFGYLMYQSRMFADTVFKQGWYINRYRVDTVFKDSVRVEL